MLLNKLVTPLLTKGESEGDSRSSQNFRQRAGDDCLRGNDSRLRG